MSEEELREEAVRRRLAGESPSEIAAAWAGRRGGCASGWPATARKATKRRGRRAIRGRLTTLPTGRLMCCVVRSWRRVSGWWPIPELNTGRWRSNGSCVVSVSTRFLERGRSNVSCPKPA